MGLVDELERLHSLHEKGALSATEFDLAKSRLMSADATQEGGRETSQGPAQSVFLGVAVWLGSVTPIPIWIWRVLFLLPVAFYYFMGDRLTQYGLQNAAGFGAGLSTVIYFVLAFSLPSYAEKKNAKEAS